MLNLFLLTTGLVIGSFLGLITYRLPRNISVVFGRSRCPGCKSNISWYDNVPVLSFLVLGGHCRNCKQEISVRYPLIEILTGVVFVFVGLNVFNLIIACLLISIFVIDLEEQIIPDELVFAGIMVFILKLLFLHQSIFESLLAGFLSASFLLFLHMVTKGRGMGLGDVKLAILIGSIMGLNLFLVWLFFSFVSGAIVGIILILVKKVRFSERIAFGPFLIAGVVLVSLFGEAFFRNIFV